VGDALDDHNLFLSVVPVGEISKGIALLKESEHKRALLVGLQTFERDYQDSLLSVDLETSHISGELTATAQEGEQDRTC
jgi:toxin FitB